MGSAMKLQDSYPASAFRRIARMSRNVRHGSRLSGNTENAGYGGIRSDIQGYIGNISRQGRK